MFEPQKHLCLVIKLGYKYIKFPEKADLSKQNR